MNAPSSHPPLRATPSLAGLVFLFERVELNCARKSLFEQRIVSHRRVDHYGRPRALSRLEILSHTLAWSAVIGAVIGFALIALFLVFNHPLVFEAKANPPQVMVIEVDS
jgi:hypothetical protein